jgi:hypothetical protein
MQGKEIYLVDKDGAKERGASGRRDKHLSAGKSKRNRWIKKGNPKKEKKDENTNTNTNTSRCRGTAG